MRVVSVRSDGNTYSLWVDGICLMTQESWTIVDTVRSMLRGEIPRTGECGEVAEAILHPSCDEQR